MSVGWCWQLLIPRGTEDGGKNNYGVVGKTWAGAGEWWGRSYPFLTGKREAGENGRGTRDRKGKRNLGRRMSKNYWNPKKLVVLFYYVYGKGKFLLSCNPQFKLHSASSWPFYSSCCPKLVPMPLAILSSKTRPPWCEGTLQASLWLFCEALLKLPSLPCWDKATKDPMSPLLRLFSCSPREPRPSLSTLCSTVLELPLFTDSVLSREMRRLGQSMAAPCFLREPVFCQPSKGPGSTLR